MIVSTKNKINTPLKFFTLVVLIALLGSCTKNTTVNNYITNPTPSDGRYGLTPTPASTYLSIPAATLPPTGGGSLPSSYFIDIPTTSFNQGSQGSCASCATAMTKSIVDHVKNGIPYPNNSIIYSPSYLYNQVNDNPNNCLLAGSPLDRNFEVLKTQGICKLTDMQYNQANCTTLPTTNQRTLAASNKINHEFRLDPINTSTIKQFIQVGLPVIVAFKVDNHFAEDYNNPNNSNTVWTNFGTYIGSNHATLLYGWDDSKNAFKMLNSWGNQWGNNGSVWVSYSLVENLNVFYQAYIIQNGPSTTTNDLQLSGDLNFGNTTVNTSATKVIQLINNGTSNIDVSSLSITSPFSANWSSGTIQPGVPRSVTITFNPTNVGNFSRTVSINSNASNSPTTLQATGSGVQQTTQTRIISLSGNLSYGNVAVGQTTSRTLTISNNGNSPLTVSSVTTPQGFSGNSNGPIQPGNSVTMSIFFSPNNVQTYTGNVVVNSDATSGINTINANGNGVVNTPTSVPPVGSYSSCVPLGSFNCPPSFGLGTITSRILNINTSTGQIVVEVKKCDGTPFNAGGNLNVVNLLCGGPGSVSYGFGAFSAGQTSIQMIIVDNNMVGSKAYVPFIVQGASSNIYYSAPTMVVTY